MKEKLVFLVAVITLVMAANAEDVDLKVKKKHRNQQNKEQQDAGRGSFSGSREHVLINPVKITDIKANRVLLYSYVVKRYGRWEGYGKPITKDYASHLRHYYKLTFTGTNKYPSRMQAYDGYHKLTTNHSVGTYLVNQTDDKDSDADSIWITKLKDVAQWDFVYNDKGDLSIERAYDTSGDLVYSYYPVKVGDRIAGTYTDAWGMPAKLRKAGGAQVVYVTYDENGFECLHEFYDELGYRQKNKDGAYMSRMKNRPDGLILTKASCNIAGQKMMDVFGNCGMEAEYDKKGRQIFDINMDDKWNPVRVKTGNDPFFYNMIKRKYEYDNFDRLTKISFVDYENKPDTNSGGIHSQVITYNDRGYISSFSYYDINGKLRVNPYSGISHWENVFDNNGRIISLKNQGDSSILSKDNYYEMYWKYDKNGNEISHLYIDFNGDSISGDTYIKTSKGLKKLTPNDIRPKNYIEIRRFADSKQIVKIEHDTQGRQILWEYSDMEGKAIAPYGYWRHITSYEDYGDSLKIMTDFYVDSLNSIVQLKTNDYGIEKNVKKYVSGKLVTSDVYQYAADSTFYKAWRNLYNSEGRKIGEASLNKYGNISRRGETLYHHCAVEYDIQGENASTYIGYDEFNEPAYIETNESVSHFWNFSNDKLTYYDENGNSITDMRSFRDSLPAVMSISITDSIAYTYGLRDGDIILKYGDWISASNLQINEANNMFYFKLIEFADREKEIILLRHLPKENKSIILKFSLPVGTIQELGFFPQLIYYTTKERQRHEYTLMEYLKQNGLTSLGNSIAPEGTHKVYIRKPNRVKGYIPTYGDAAPHHYNPAIVLSMAKYMKRDSTIIADEYWNIGMGADTLVNILKSKDNSSYYISVSTNLKDSYDDYPYYANAHEWGFVNISEEPYSRVMRINDDFIQRHGNSFNPAYRKIKSQIKSKKMNPMKLFQNYKNKSEVIYLKKAIGFINKDSIRIPECFKNMEMVYISKAQCKDMYIRIKEDMDKLDTTGYVRLPNFYSEDLALVKVAKNNVYSEFFMIYFTENDVRLFRQKGLFSMDELMAIQKTYGKQMASSLYDTSDASSQIPLICAFTEQEGLARQFGIEGTYVILEYNKWNMFDGLENIEETLEMGKESKKRLVLMQIHRKDDNTFSHFDTPQLYELNEGILGMRIFDWGISKSLYERAISAYDKFKINHKKNYR